MGKREDILALAPTYDLIPYQLDPPPNGVTGIDCSLYVLAVYNDAGIPFHGVRTAEQIRQVCVPIPWTDVLPGDLLFFENTYDAGAPSSDGHIASHIGISLGAGTGKMWDAHERENSPDAVGLTTINPSDYWQSHIFEARRAPQLAGEQPMATFIRGIDVSSHQGVVDWKRVRQSGIEFAYTKATGGTWYKNPTLAANWAGMKANGIKKGAYHWAFETSGQPFPGDGPEAEADYFIAAMKPLGIEPGDMLALDMEDGQGQLGDWTLRWCQRVEQRVGFKPEIYTGRWFSGPHGLATTPALKAYKLWLADYQDNLPSTPAPWDKITIWQHTSAGNVPGVNGDCDLDLFNGTLIELKALGSPGGPVAGDDPFVVGTGLRQLMTEDSTTPLASSTWLPLGQFPADVEEAIGKNGVKYLWHLPSGAHWRYPHV